MSIAFIDLAAQQQRIRERIEARIRQVLDHGRYIMGPEVRELEEALSDFTGVKHVLTCGNGTDALQLALMALGASEGDAVFCPSFTFAATAEVVPLVGATPVFVDVRADSFNMDVESLKRAIRHARSLGLRPAGIIPVDLFGLPADHDELQAIARENGMWVLVDGAQGLGAIYKGAMSVSRGDIATTSFFPAKPLGCYGDGGAVFTNDDELAEKVASLRVHGKGRDKYDNVRIGVNSRLDTIQAAILLEKLAIFPDEIEQRNRVAERYSDALRDAFNVPEVPRDRRSVWAQYTLRTRPGQNRDAIMQALKEQGIPSVVYYPTPLHRLAAYKDFPRGDELKTTEELSRTVFSLPMHPYLDDRAQEQITAALMKLA